MNILPFFDRLEDIIVTFLAHQVYLAPIILLTIEEAGLPLPIADYVIAYTGYQVSKGHIPYFTAFSLLVLADLLGASILYYLCSRYGEDLIFRIDKYIHLDKHKLSLVEKYFRKYGIFFIIFGRHIIGFRIPITVFSGISKMKYTTFLLGTFLSIVWWIPFYLDVGRRLGPKTASLFHTNHWFFIILFIPIILSFAPFFFLRKKNNSQK